MVFERLSNADYAAMPGQPVTLRETWPLLFVQNIDRSAEFYRDLLGFEVVNEAKSGEQVFWCRLKRQTCSLMLQQAEPEDGHAEGHGRGVVLYFLCDDADAMHAELMSRGLLLKNPTTAYYGMRQVELRDPDGYQLCFESESNPETG
jgi:glyoxylase I family protein